MKLKTYLMRIKRLHWHSLHRDAFGLYGASSWGRQILPQVPQCKGLLQRGYERGDDGSGNLLPSRSEGA